MEIDGTDAWKIVRRRVVRTGPLKVLRRMATAGADLAPVLESTVERVGARRVLRRFGESLPPEQAAEAAFDRLTDLAMPRKRLQGRTRQVADTLALAILDTWAAEGDNPGADVSGCVVEALGSHLASMVFDSAVLAQTVSAWKLDDRIFEIGENSEVYSVHSRLKDVLLEWAEHAPASITCPTLKYRGIER